MIDAIDYQLDGNMATVILERLHQAFPRLQILATGERPELLERASRFQCLKLENKQLYSLHPEAWQQQFEHIYASLHLEDHPKTEDATPLPIEILQPDVNPIQSLVNQISEQLNEQQRLELIQRLQFEDDNSNQQHLL
ncbi:hypothetical protein D9K79_05935 [Acinetobacter cumulans]|uniref:STAS domain-containing protein n=1 Tax=Acinetobacter cumulans TaxID=2136182 RepID=A0ABX9U7W3_9GAMM|nr:hypothetical protein D9K79_05935 [Acinetobacter cumulans]